ncbi:MAG: hypothetical protein ACXWNR_07515 [Candidatus Limnocylindrales bacterium]
MNRGAAVLIADMTTTVSCDYAGGEAVFRAYQRAVISGTDLRLVVTAQIVRRVLSYEGLDRLVSIYPPWRQPKRSGRQRTCLAWCPDWPAREPMTRRCRAVPLRQGASCRQPGHRTETEQPSRRRRYGA